MRTRSTCVAKSTAASATLMRADSWMPMMLRPTSSAMTMAPTMMSHGFCFNGAQKIER